MNPRQLTICLEKRWVTRNRLIHQISRLQQCLVVSGAESPSQNKILGAAVKVEGSEINRGWALDGQLLSRRKFGVKLSCDPLRDLALNCKHVLEIAIVFFRPDVGIGAGVDQLDVYVKPGACLANTAFQDVGYT